MTDKPAHLLSNEEYQKIDEWIWRNTPMVSREKFDMTQQSESHDAQKTVAAHTESREAFEKWLLAPYDPETDALWECWLASCESLRAKLLSDEMVEIVAQAIHANYGTVDYDCEESLTEFKGTAKAALHAVVEGLVCK